MKIDGDQNTLHEYRNEKLAIGLVKNNLVISGMLSPQDAKNFIEGREVKVGFPKKSSLKESVLEKIDQAIHNLRLKFSKTYQTNFKAALDYVKKSREDSLKDNKFDEPSEYEIIANNETPTIDEASRHRELSEEDEDVPVFYLDKKRTSDITNIKMSLLDKTTESYVSELESDSDTSTLDTSTFIESSIDEETEEDPQLGTVESLLAKPSNHKLESPTAVPEDAFANEGILPANKSAIELEVDEHITPKDKPPVSNTDLDKSIQDTEKNLKTIVNQIKEFKKEKTLNTDRWSIEKQLMWKNLDPEEKMRQLQSEFKKVQANLDALRDEKKQLM